MTIAPALKRYCKSKKLTQAQLARILRRPRSTVCAWMKKPGKKGSHAPRLDDLPGLARQLETTVSALLGEVAA